MRLYYRIQPRGLGIDGHESESSAGARSGIDVFSSPAGTFNTDVPVWHYGDEVVVIAADRSWNNGDVEGARINPAKAHVVKRYTWKRWTDLARDAAGIPEGARWDRGLEWEDGDDVWTADDVDMRRFEEQLEHELLE